MAETLVLVPSVNLATWTSVLRPVRGKLVPALVEIFRSHDRPQIERSLAAEVLADYAGDQVKLLADLILHADAKQFAAIFPKLRVHGRRVVALLEAELVREAGFDWQDLPLKPAWVKEPSKSVVAKIESGLGALDERFAFCQTMPWDDFANIVDSLDRCGYRPVRFRPYSQGATLRVAAVWTRDGRDWRAAYDLTPEQIRAQSTLLIGQGFCPGGCDGLSCPGPPR